MKALYSVILTARSIARFNNASEAENSFFEDTCTWIESAFSHAIVRRFKLLSMYGMELTGEEVALLNSDNRIQAVCPVSCFDSCALQYPANWGLEVACGNNVGQGYEYRYTGKGVKIYIVDSGMDLAHPDFEGRAIHGYDAMVVAPGNPESHSDRTPLVSSHGTSVASMAGGKYCGSAKGVTLVDVKVGDADPTATPPSSFNSLDIIEGLQWILSSRAAAGDSSPYIVNCSFGNYTNDPALYNVIANGIYLDNGITVAGAGNDARNSASGAGHIFYPAAWDQVMGIGAIQEDLSIAPFSNYGALNAEFYAPGRFVAVAVPGGHITTASGTSLASPLVAGAIACAIEGLQDVDHFMAYKMVRAQKQIRNGYWVINARMIKSFYGDETTVGRLKPFRRVTLKHFRQPTADNDSKIMTGEVSEIAVVKRCSVAVRLGKSVTNSFGLDITRVNVVPADNPSAE